MLNRLLAGWKEKMVEFKFPWCSMCENNFPMRIEEYEELEVSGNTFYCPQGHTLMISRESIVDRMRSSERSGCWRSNTIRGLHKRMESLRGVRTRERNRLLRGACPYCNKNSGDIVKHIQLHHKSKVSK